MANTVVELIWIIHLLRDLNALPSDHPTILCDNLSAICLSQNLVAHWRAKHIDIDYHFIREFVFARKLHIYFFLTKLQVVNILTKPLPIPLFESFWECLRVGPHQFRLRVGSLHIYSNIVKSLSLDVILVR